MAANKRPVKSKRNGDVRDFEMENGVVKRRIETLYEMIGIMDTRTADHMASTQLLKEALSHVNNGFKTESSKAEPEYLQLRQQYADMKAHYNKILENMREQIANAKRDNGMQKISHCVPLATRASGDTQFEAFLAVLLHCLKRLSGGDLPTDHKDSPSVPSC